MSFPYKLWFRLQHGKVGPPLSTREGPPVMHCPFCRNTDTKVSDSRATEDGSAIRRRRVCPVCERKFTTVEQLVLTVVKRSGVVESFNRDKVIMGVSKACKGRPVTAAQLAALAQRVEESLRASGQAAQHHRVDHLLT